jgi:hypothetical protein
MGEKLGISAMLMLTPTPPSPVEREGTGPRLAAVLVPNSIDHPLQEGRKRKRARRKLQGSAHVGMALWYTQRSRLGSHPWHSDGACWMLPPQVG